MREIDNELRLPTSSKVALVLGSLGSAVAGEWFGEAPSHLGVLVYAVLVSIVLLLALATLVLSRAVIGHPGARWPVLASGAALLSSMFAGGVLLGNQVEVRAFNDCVRHGEDVRQTLSEFRAAQGRYPESLNALDRANLPGKRLFRGTMLTYRSDGTSYRMEFTDLLVTHVATDNQPFVAFK